MATSTNGWIVNESVLKFTYTLNFLREPRESFNYDLFCLVLCWSAAYMFFGVYGQDQEPCISFGQVDIQ